MKKKIRLVEKIGFLSPDKAAKDGSIWDVVLIEKGASKNGRYYRAEVLKQAAPLFEGLPAKAYMFGNALPIYNHLPPSEDEKRRPDGGRVDYSANTVGFYKNARYGEFVNREGQKSEGILAEFHILAGHSWLKENLVDAFSKGMEKILGFSIDARGDSKKGVIDGKQYFVVEKIDEVVTTDIVSEPAAGGRVLRLVASTGDPQMKYLLSLLMKYRPSWVNTIKESDLSDDEKTKRLVEAAHQLVNQVILEKIPVTDFASISAASKSQAALVSASRFLQEGKPEQAAGVLEPWLSKVSETSSYEGFLYPEATQTPAPTPAPAPVRESQEDNRLLEETRNLQRELKIERNNSLVSRRVSESSLPKAAQIRVIEDLSNRENITEAAISDRIQRESSYLSQIAPPQGHTGLGNAYGTRAPVQVGAEKKDKLQKAMDLMFNAQEMDQSGIRAFSSLKEAWAQYNPHATHYDNAKMSRWIFEAIAKSFPPAIFACNEPLDAFEQHQNFIKENWSNIASYNLKEAVTSSEFTVAFGTSFLKRMISAYTNDPRSNWRRIVSPNYVNLQDATRTFELVRMGDIPILPRVAERDAYLELIEDPTEAKENLTPYKYGGIYTYTWESVMVDDLSVLRRIPFNLARSANLRIARNVFTNLEDNITMNATSAAVISTTHNNRISGDPALSYSAITSGVKLFRNQTAQDSNEKLGLSPRLLLTDPEKEQVGWELTASDRKATSAEDSTLESFVKAQRLEHISTVELGRAAGTKYRWYMLADPAEHEGIVVGFLGGRSTPDIFVQGEQTPTSGQYFTNDVITFKIRLVMGSTVADFRPFVGSLASS